MVAAQAKAPVGYTAGYLEISATTMPKGPGIESRSRRGTCNGVCACVPSLPKICNPTFMCTLRLIKAHLGPTFKKNYIVLAY